MDKLKEPIDEDENTFLHIICKLNKHDMLQMFIDAGLNINSKNCVNIYTFCSSDLN